MTPDPEPEQFDPVPIDPTLLPQPERKEMQLPEKLPRHYRAMFALMSEFKGVESTGNPSIAATKVCVEVLKRFGFPAVRPLATRVRVFNSPLAHRFSEYAMQNGSAPPDDLILSWQKEPGSIDYAVGLGYGAPTRDPMAILHKWHGHLVCLAGQFLLDPTLGLVNNPDKLLVGFKPSVIRTTDEFLAGRERLPFVRPDDAFVAYELHGAGHAMDWIKDPDWTQSQRTAITIHHLIKTVRSIIDRT